MDGGGVRADGRATELRPPRRRSDVHDGVRDARGARRDGRGRRRRGLDVGPADRRVGRLIRRPLARARAGAERRGVRPSAPFAGAGVDARTGGWRRSRRGESKGAPRDLKVYGKSGEAARRRGTAVAAAAAAAAAAPTPTSSSPGATRATVRLSATRAATEDNPADDAGAKIWRFADRSRSVPRRCCGVDVRAGFRAEQNRHGRDTDRRERELGARSRRTTTRRRQWQRRQRRQRAARQAGTRTKQPVVAPASLEVALDPSETATTERPCWCRARRRRPRRPRPGLRLGGPQPASKGITVSRRRRLVRRPPVRSRVDSLATLGTVRVVAVTCPGDADDATNATLDPSEVRGDRSSVRRRRRRERPRR